MDNDKEVTQQQIKGELDKVSKNTKKLADLPSFGLDSGDQDSKQKIINMIDGAYSDSIIPAPASDGYSYIPAFEIQDNVQLPMVSVSAKDYRNFSEQFNLIELKDMLYGTSGKWAYNIEADSRAPFYVKNGQQILPPSWSIMYDVFRTKTFVSIENFERAVDNQVELENVATQAGFSSAAELQKELQQLKNLIEY